jgi:hypothetical protein
VDDAGTWTTALLGHFALRAPSRRAWQVDFGVMEWGVMRGGVAVCGIILIRLGAKCQKYNIQDTSRQ